VRWFCFLFPLNDRRARSRPGFPRCCPHLPPSRLHLEPLYLRFCQRGPRSRSERSDSKCAAGVGFVSLGEGIDTSTPAGRLQLHVLGAIAEFERSRLRERVVAGLQRARRDGKRLGRPPRQVTARDLAHVAGLSVRAAARELKVSPSVLQRARHDAAGEAQRG